jgi:hypothetical protein
MTGINRRESRDEVLLAFHEAYERPTADQIIEWAERYPQFAEDIRAHAAVSWDWSGRGNAPQEQSSEIMLASAYSRALSALYDAEIESAPSGSQAAPAGFHEILAAQGKDIPSIAREIGGSMRIARSVVADLFNGAMLAPVSMRLSGAVQRCLSLNAGAFHAALERALAKPRLGHANATTTPTIQPRSCEEVIRTSDMSKEQIKYWLDED